MGFGMVDVCGHVTLERGEEVSADEDWGSFLHFPVSSGEDFGESNKD